MRTPCYRRFCVVMLPRVIILICLKSFGVYYCTGKSQQLYESALRAVLQAIDELGATADPSTIICNFETAAMNAVGAVFGDHVAIQGCFYHLCQSTWR